MSTPSRSCPAVARARAPEEADRRWPWPSGVALAMSMLACYGTLAAVLVLPMFGMTLAPDDTLWRVAIVAPAALVVVSLGGRARRRASWLPTGLAAAGAVLLAILMFWHMNRWLEALAFALLLAAVVIERRRCTRCAPSDGGAHRHE